MSWLALSGLVAITLATVVGVLFAFWLRSSILRLRASEHAQANAVHTHGLVLSDQRDIVRAQGRVLLAIAKAMQIEHEARDLEQALHDSGEGLL